MDYKIIDFHTHPYLTAEQNICKHKDFFEMSPETTLRTMDGLGISRFCGAVIKVGDLQAGETWWDRIRECNDAALSLREKYGERYILGFHVHPDFVKESFAEIDRMYARGVRLIGELVPYLTGYKYYNTEELNEIVGYAAKKKMVISIHDMGDKDDLAAFASANKDATIVVAHPGEYASVLGHIKNMKEHENYYLDLSGTGLFRHGMLRRLIDEVGAERILFGSDYPTCNPAMFVGGVVLDELLTEREKRLILYENAERLLCK